MISNPRYKIITYGCQMNKSDSERIEGLLDSIGFSEAKSVNDADLILLNTCSVRQTAEDRVYGMMRGFAKLKVKKPHLLVGVTGCMAGRDKDGKIKKRMSDTIKKISLKSGAKSKDEFDIDLFFGISDLPKVPEMIAKLWSFSSLREGTQAKQSLTTLSLRGSPAQRGATKQSYRSKDRRALSTKLAMTDLDYLGIAPNPKEWWRGWVVIQTGCSKYCTYCVVPHARGHEKNRKVADILKEIKTMVKGGVKEVVLLGQAVNSYPDFAGLLKKINDIEGINRISFASAHPMHMTDEVINALALPKMINYLHLPVQSGNNEVLRKMNRKYTRENYLSVIEKIKKVRPDIALATDIIVGFPGEGEREFKDTVSLYKKCDFDMSYNAKYSPRSGTVAYSAFPDDVSREDKRKRWLELQALMEKNVLRKNKKYNGKIVEVLVDSYRAGKCIGLSREYKRVIFPGDKSMIGGVYNVKITKAKEWELEGLRQ